MKPLVSIICITYNQEQYIEKALDGFLMQKTNFPFEILIHDDASTDNTRKIIEKYAEKHKEIFRPFYEEENQYSKGNYKFIEAMYKAARGKYIAWCEGDDFWTDPQKLQLQVDFLNKKPEYALCFHPVKVFYERSEQKSFIFPNVNDVTKFTINELLKRNFIQSNSVMYKKQKYNKLPKNNVMPQDWYLHLYHAQFGKIGFINKVMSSYRRHKGGVWWGSYENINKIWEKHGISHLSLYIELLKIYSKDDERKKIITESLNNTFNDVLVRDKKDGLQLLKRALQDFPNNSELSIMIQHFEHEDKLRDHIEEQGKVISHLNDELADKSRQFDNAMLELSKMTTELSKMKNTKSWKAIERLSKAKGRLKI